MTTETPVLNKIRVSIQEFIKWSPGIWEAVNEARCGPGTAAGILQELMSEARCITEAKAMKTWVSGGQFSGWELCEFPLFIDPFYREGTLAFNGPKGPLSVSNIPFVSL